MKARVCCNILSVCLGLTASSFVLAKSATENYALANCENEVKTKEGSLPITVEHKFQVQNNTAEVQTIKATYTFCPPNVNNPKCLVKEKSFSLNPYGVQSDHHFSSDNVGIHKPGNYDFKVVTEISGYTYMRSEKHCGLHVKKE